MARFGPWKIPKCFENGPFRDQKWVTSGSKTRFSKSDHGPFGMLKQVFLAHLELVVMRFGPWKIPKCLGNGPFSDQKWVKNGSKTHFSKSDPRPFGMGHLGRQKRQHTKNGWSQDPETLLRLKIRKNQKNHDFRPQTGGGRFLTPTPTPPHPPPPPSRAPKIGFKWGGSGGVRTKNSLGEVLIGQNNDFTRG